MCFVYNSQRNSESKPLQVTNLKIINYKQVRMHTALTWFLVKYREIVLEKNYLKCYYDKIHVVLI